jgi:alpha-L-fucosidase 2
VKGLKAKGGFEVDIEWDNGDISNATIKSSLGGNCRIRSYIPLKGKGLIEAKGPNVNPLFSISEIKVPLNHSQTPNKALNLTKVYEYDLSTQKGDVIEIDKLQ